MPVPPLDRPRLKNLVCAVKRGESGSNRIAKASSNDSSISCRVKELSRLKGGLVQSNSIAVQLYIVRPCNVVTLYLHIGKDGVKGKSGKRYGHRCCDVRRRVQRGATRKPNSQVVGHF